MADLLAMSLPLRIRGQPIDDSVMKTLATQGLFDVGDDSAERVADLGFDLSEGRFGSSPFGSQLAYDPARLCGQRHPLHASIGACSGANQSRRSHSSDFLTDGRVSPLHGLG